MEVDDYLKSEQQGHHHSQMEMMSMIMDRMDDLPELYGSYNEISELPSPELSSGGATTTDDFHHNHNGGLGASQPYVNHPTTISYMGSPQAQEGFLPNLSNSASHDHLTTSFATQSQKKNSIAAMREMIFRIAAMQPIHIDPESVKPPKRRNVKISKDPQSVAARHRRERISERIRILQRLVPGGTKMDTASMLDEAIHYVKFLKSQVQSLERVSATPPPPVGFPVPMSNGSYVEMPKTYRISQNGQHFGEP